MNFKKIADTSFKSVGDSFLSSVTKMFNCILKEKQPSDQWEKVNIQTMYKGKGSKKILYNYRAIFLTNIWSKTFEKIVYSRMYNNISNYISPFQTGSQKNRGANDNTFLWGGSIDHSLYTNSPLSMISNNVLTVYGFKTACYAYRMLAYKMNCFI